TCFRIAPQIAPPVRRPPGPVEIANAPSSVDVSEATVPNCRVHSALPVLFHARTNASPLPWLVPDRNVPNVSPATKTFEFVAAIAQAPSRSGVPNWRVHPLDPSRPSCMRNPSAAPLRVNPGNAPAVPPATNTPVEETETAVASSCFFVPNWSVQTISPLGSYCRAYVS